MTRLLEAAYRLIRERGVVEPGVRDVLAEAGLANRSFYRHFASKDEFWLVLVEDLQTQLTAMVHEAVSMQAEPVERVRAWMLAVLWTTLVGEPGWVDDPRFSDDVQRAAHRDVLNEQLAQWCAERTTAEALETLDRSRIPAGPVLSPQQVLDDLHVTATKAFADVEYPRCPPARSRCPEHRST